MSRTTRSLALGRTVFGRCKRTGKEYPQIWHLFAFKPEATDIWRASRRSDARPGAPHARVCGN